MPKDLHVLAHESADQLRTKGFDVRIQPFESSYVLQLYYGQSQRFSQKAVISQEEDAFVFTVACFPGDIQYKSLGKFMDHLTDLARVYDKFEKKVKA